MRTRYAAGNWKMNTTLTGAQALTSEIVNLFSAFPDSSAHLLLAPPFPFLGAVNFLIAGNDRIHLCAQNVHEEAQGAFTGEVSASMLQSVGCTHCIIGHSERRQYFHEKNGLLLKKARTLLAHGIRPVYCLGETLAQRQDGSTFTVIEEQMRDGIFPLSADEFARCIIAYEPVWAIGTGMTATPEQAQEVHAFIRRMIADVYDDSLAQSTSILYGGSVNASNAASLFAQPDIDGGLVGGASLKSRDFIEIASALR